MIIVSGPNNRVSASLLSYSDRKTDSKSKTQIDDDGKRIVIQAGPPIDCDFRSRKMEHKRKYFWTKHHYKYRMHNFGASVSFVRLDAVYIYARHGKFDEASPLIRAVRGGKITEAAGHPAFMVIDTTGGAEGY